MGIELAHANLSKEVKTFGNSARTKIGDNGLDFLDALNQSAPTKPIATKNLEKIETPIKAVTNPKAKVQNSDRDEAGQISLLGTDIVANQINPNQPMLLVDNEGANAPIADINDTQNNGSIDLGTILAQTNIQAITQGQLPPVANDALGQVAIDKQSALIGAGTSNGSLDAATLLLKGSPLAAAEVTNGLVKLELEGSKPQANQTPFVKDTSFMADISLGDATANPSQLENAKALVPKSVDNTIVLDAIGMGNKAAANKEGQISDLANNFAQPNNEANSQDSGQSGNSSGGQNQSNNGQNNNGQSNNPIMVQSAQKALNSATKAAELKANAIKEKADLSGALPEIVDSFGSALDQLGQNGTTSMDAPMTSGQTNDSARINMSALAAMIARRHLNGEKSIFVRLDPAELGGVRVELKFGANKKLSAIINVEKADALRELSNNSANLLQSLRDSGLEVAENAIEFQLDNAPNQQEQSQSWAGEYRKSNSIGQSSENNDEVIIGKTEAKNQSIKMPHLEIWKRARISLEA